MELQTRTAEQLKEHYLVERELADRLRYSSKGERQQLYSIVYDELYRRVPHHPQLTYKSSSQERHRVVLGEMRLLQHFLRPEMCFLEVGSGDCALSFEAARRVKKVYAIDVSDEITRSTACPENFALILSNGSSVDVEPQTVNVAYSFQLMEHLHPEDASDQLQSIYHALKKGGEYVCVTPNRLNGPHDISAYFDPIPTGFHLKEYTVTELSDLFRKVGFSRVTPWIGIKGHFARCPLWPIRICEKFLSTLPRRLRLLIARNLPIRLLLDIHLVGTK
jgi:SAM-dependent methyltransferase